MIGTAIAAGFVATLVMTTIMRGASEFGLTRIDFALLLGTAVSDNRRKARAFGYVFHFVVGILFNVPRTRATTNSSESAAQSVWRTPRAASIFHCRAATCRRGRATGCSRR